MKHFLITVLTIMMFFSSAVTVNTVKADEPETDSSEETTEVLSDEVPETDESEEELFDSTEDNGSESENLDEYENVEIDEISVKAVDAEVLNTSAYTKYYSEDNAICAYYTGDELVFEAVSEELIRRISSIGMNDNNSNTIYLYNFTYYKVNGNITRCAVSKDKLIRKHVNGTYTLNFIEFNNEYGSSTFNSIYNVSIPIELYDAPVFDESCVAVADDTLIISLPVGYVDNNRFFYNLTNFDGVYNNSDEVGIDIGGSRLYNYSNSSRTLFYDENTNTIRISGDTIRNAGISNGNKKITIYSYGFKPTSFTASISIGRKQINDLNVFTDDSGNLYFESSDYDFINCLINKSNKVNIDYCKDDSWYYLYGSNTNFDFSYSTYNSKHRACLNSDAQKNAGFKNGTITQIDIRITDYYVDSFCGSVVITKGTDATIPQGYLILKTGNETSSSFSFPYTGVQHEISDVDFFYIDENRSWNNVNSQITSSDNNVVSYNPSTRKLTVKSNDYASFRYVLNETSYEVAINDAVAYMETVNNKENLKLVFNNDKYFGRYDSISLNICYDGYNYKYFDVCGADYSENKLTKVDKYTYYLTEDQIYDSGILSGTYEVGLTMWTGNGGDCLVQIKNVYIESKAKEIPSSLTAYQNEDGDFVMSVDEEDADYLYHLVKNNTSIDASIYLDGSRNGCSGSGGFSNTKYKKVISDPYIENGKSYIKIAKQELFKKNLVTGNYNVRLNVPGYSSSEGYPLELANVRVVINLENAPELTVDEVEIDGTVYLHIGSSDSEYLKALKNGSSYIYIYGADSARGDTLYEWLLNSNISDSNNLYLTEYGCKLLGIEKNKTVSVGFSALGYKTSKIYTYTSTIGTMRVPEDVTVVLTSDGCLTVTSNNSGYLDSINYIEIYNRNIRKKYFSYIKTDGVTTAIKINNETLKLTIINGNGQYYVCLSSNEYDSFNKYVNFTEEHFNLLNAPEISFDDCYIENDNLVIALDGNSEFLRNLTYIDDITLNSDVYYGFEFGTGVEIENDDESRFISAKGNSQQFYYDAINNRVIISGKLLRYEGVKNGECTITLYSYGYKKTEFTYNLTIGKNILADSDVSVYQTSSGNLIIESKEENFIDCIRSSGWINFIKMTEHGADYDDQCGFSLEDNFRKTYDSEKETYALTVPLSYILRNSVTSGIKEYHIYCDEYDEITGEVYIEKGCKTIDKVNIKVTKNGIEISCDDPDYISKITNIYFSEKEGDSSYWFIIYCEYENYIKNNKLIIPYDVLNSNEAASGTYKYVYIESDGYVTYRSTNENIVLSTKIKAAPKFEMRFENDSLIIKAVYSGKSTNTDAVNYIKKVHGIYLYKQIPESNTSYEVLTTTGGGSYDEYCWLEYDRFTKNKDEIIISRKTLNALAISDMTVIIEGIYADGYGSACPYMSVKVPEIVDNRPIEGIDDVYEQDGRIYIEADADWLKSVATVEDGNSFYGIKLKNSVREYWVHNYSDEYHELNFEDGKLWFSIADMRNGNYRLTLKSYDYQDVSCYVNITDGKLVPPELTVTQDDTTGDILLSSENENYLKAIRRLFIYNFNNSCYVSNDMHYPMSDPDNLSNSDKFLYYDETRECAVISGAYISSLNLYNGTVINLTDIEAEGYDTNSIEDIRLTCVFSLDNSEKEISIVQRSKYKFAVLCDNEDYLNRITKIGVNLKIDKGSWVGSYEIIKVGNELIIDLSRSSSIPFKKGDTIEVGIYASGYGVETVSGTGTIGFALGKGESYYVKIVDYQDNIISENTSSKMSLEVGDSFRIVEGIKYADGTIEEFYAECNYGYEYTNDKLVSEEEYNSFTALKPGTVNFTVYGYFSEKVYKVTVPVKIIDRQISNITAYIDDGNDEPLLEYSFTLDDIEGQSFRLAAICKDKNDEDIAAKGIKWSTSDSSVASIVNTKDGNFVKINKAGQITVTATSSNGKATGSFVLRIKDYVPVLETDTITINYLQENPEAYIDLHTMYDSSVLDVPGSVYLLDQKGNTQERFTAEYTEGKIVIKPLVELNKNSTEKYKIYVNIVAEGNIKEYSFNLTVKVNGTYPSISVKTSGKIDLFDFSNSTAELLIDSKGYTVESISSDIFTESYVNLVSRGNGRYRLEISDMPVNNKGQYITKGSFEVKLEGYKPKTYTGSFGTVKNKPSYVLSASSVNLKSTSTDFSVSILDKKTKELIDIYDDEITVSSRYYDNWYVSDNRIIFNIDEVVKESFNITLKKEGWNEGISYKISVNKLADNKLPSINAPTITLNRRFLQDGSADIVLNVSGMVVSEGEIIDTKTSNDGLSVIYDSANNVVTAEVIDSDIKAGTYRYTLTGVKANDDTLKDATVTVKVVDSEPLFKIVDAKNKQLSTVKLNLYTVGEGYGSDSVTAGYSLSNNAYGLEVVDCNIRFVPGKNQNEDDVVINFDEEHLTVYVTDSAITGNYVFYVSPVYSEFEDTVTKEVKFTVNVYNKKPTVSIKVKNSINPLDLNSYVVCTPTIANLTNEKLLDSPVTLTNDNGLLKGEVVNGELRISLSDTAVITKDTTLKNITADVVLENTGYELKTGTFTINIKEAAPSVKLSASSINMYNSSIRNSEIGMINISLSNANCHFIKGNYVKEDELDGNITYRYYQMDESKNSSKIQQAFRSYLVEVYEDGEFAGYRIAVELVDGSYSKAGSTTTLKYELKYEGDNYTKQKATTITYKVVDKSASKKK